MNPAPLVMQDVFLSATLDYNDTCYLIIQTELTVYFRKHDCSYCSCSGT